MIPDFSRSVGKPVIDFFFQSFAASMTRYGYSSRREKMLSWQNLISKVRPDSYLFAKPIGGCLATNWKRISIRVCRSDAVRLHRCFAFFPRQ